MSELNKFVISENDLSRLDKFLVIQFPDLSRSRLQALIKGGFVKINENIITKTGYELGKGMIIQIEIPETVDSSLMPEDIELDIVYETRDLLIVNKPAGMVVHPAFGHNTGTLVNAALAHSPEMEGIGGERRPGVVHRLDKDTSGIILMAKNDRTHRFLQEQFKNRTVKKTYLAITDGNPPTPQGLIEAAIGRDPSHRKKMAIVPIQRGREASTQYRVLEAFKHNALVEAKPLTGRTHQIRLHLAFLECPIVGDQLYGHRKLSLDVKRQMLHAFKLEVILPGESKVSTFEVPLPADMESALFTLRNH
ncbi:MAG: RNA pseudouridine synthase [Chloroflexi bacterium HGW-Chloroflexi-8]|jgi:23S rRNA pseudouridine1911/1915/1917 synthase|nr:MAG: RNA pseudouridine synthase [Chloroflexi bacterium HGW-Chloroflexi-8]